MYLNALFLAACLALRTRSRVRGLGWPSVESILELDGECGTRGIAFVACEMILLENGRCLRLEGEVFAGRTDNDEAWLSFPPSRL